MAARSTMGWIIADLRRKVHDVGAQEFDTGVQYAGDTTQLKCIFYNLASTAVTPTKPRVTIWNPLGSALVNSVTSLATATTGVQYYNYKIPSTGPEGIWRSQFVGILGTVTSAYTAEFEVRITQRIWTDDQLEDYLDRHRMFVGDDGGRELLRHDAFYKRYISNFNTWEWAKLYTTNDTNATELTTATADLLVGEWTFTTAQNIDVYAEGHCYNVYLAAAECLEELAGDPSRASSWSRGGITHKSQDPLELAMYYRRLAHGGRSVKLIRTY